MKNNSFKYKYKIKKSILNKRSIEIQNSVLGIGVSHENFSDIKKLIPLKHE